MNDTRIVTEARRAHASFWRPTSDEGTGDRHAAAVTRAWQQALQDLPGIGFEVSVASGLNERIDVVDHENGIAYELKVSGKNAGHEYFKDIFKVLAFNQERSNPIKRLVFLTEAFGAARLHAGLGGYATRFGEQLGIELEIVGL